MSMLIEKVARLFEDSIVRHGGSTGDLEGTRDDATAAIAAVLDALQEPSEGMEDTGMDIANTATDEDLPQSSWAIWQAMLAKFREEQGV